jgi:hypothetical protein
MATRWQQTGNITRHHNPLRLSILNAVLTSLGLKVRFAHALRLVPAPMSPSPSKGQNGTSFLAGQWLSMITKLNKSPCVKADYVIFLGLTLSQRRVEMLECKELTRLRLCKELTRLCKELTRLCKELTRL